MTDMRKDMNDVIYDDSYITVLRNQADRLTMDAKARLEEFECDGNCANCDSEADCIEYVAQYMENNQGRDSE